MLTNKDITIFLFVILILLQPATLLSQTENHQNRLPVDFIILIDVSSTMSLEKYKDLSKIIARVMYNNVDSGDYVYLATFCMYSWSQKDTIISYKGQPTAIWNDVSQKIIKEWFEDKERKMHKERTSFETAYLKAKDSYRNRFDSGNVGRRQALLVLSDGIDDTGDSELNVDMVHCIQKNHKPWDSLIVVLSGIDTVARQDPDLPKIDEFYIYRDYSDASISAIRRHLEEHINPLAQKDRYQRIIDSLQENPGIILLIILAAPASIVGCYYGILAYRQRKRQKHDEAVQKKGTKVKKSNSIKFSLLIKPIEGTYKDRTTEEKCTILDDVIFEVFLKNVTKRNRPNELEIVPELWNSVLKPIKARPTNSSKRASKTPYVFNLANILYENRRLIEITFSEKRQINSSRIDSINKERQNRKRLQRIIREVQRPRPVFPIENVIDDFEGFSLTFPDELSYDQQDIDDNVQLQSPRNKLILELTYAGGEPQIDCWPH